MLSTSWIGRNGILDIQAKIVKQETVHQVKTLKKELNILAKECAKAFEVAGLSENENPHVRRAITVCSSYVWSKPGFEQRSSKSSTIERLWKQQMTETDEANRTNPSNLASTILREKLVETLTEKKHQPPDVSCMFTVPCACISLIPCKKSRTCRI